MHMYKANKCSQIDINRFVSVDLAFVWSGHIFGETLNSVNKKNNMFNILCNFYLLLNKEFILIIHIIKNVLICD